MGWAEVAPISQVMKATERPCWYVLIILEIFEILPPTTHPTFLDANWDGFCSIGGSVKFSTPGHPQ